MRSLYKLFIVISISIIFLGSGLVSALNSNELSASLLWSSETLYAAGTVTVRVTLNSNYAGELKIQYIGIHFDWMPTDGFYGHDLSTSPVTISSGGSYLFNAFSVEIPYNASAGSHSYYIGVEGTEQSTSSASVSTFSWDSPTATIQVSSVYQKICIDLKSEVQSKLNEAVSANYQNAEAKSLLKQAQTEYELATSYMDAEQWNDAMRSLETASNYLEQASIAEQEGGEPVSLLPYVAIAIVVIIVVSLIVVVVLKKRKQTKPLTDQPLKPVESKVEKDSVQQCFS
jgi:hypothetical protein